MGRKLFWPTYMWGVALISQKFCGDGFEYASLTFCETFKVSMTKVQDWVGVNPVRGGRLSIGVIGTNEREYVGKSVLGPV